MLMIKIGPEIPLMLDRKLSESGGWGVWEYHRAASSWYAGPPHYTYRYARIRPAEPKDGAQVEVFLMHTSHAEEKDWISRGTGIAKNGDY